MYKHRTYIEKTNDFEKMTELVTRLNSMHLCDWSLGRLFAWKYGRWDKKSQDDLEFEKQAELFFDPLENLCGIILTENFGCDYYFLSEKDETLIQTMVAYLKEKNVCDVECSVILSTEDIVQQKVLIKNGFTYHSDADVTYLYSKNTFVPP